MEFSLGNNVELSTSYTYNDTEDSSGLQRVRRPRHLANVDFEFTAFDSKLNLLTSARYSADARDRFAPLPDYTVVDFSVNYRLDSAIELFGRIENLTNKKYLEIIGFNTAGRTAYVGARYNF